LYLLCTVPTAHEHILRPLLLQTARYLFSGGICTALPVAVSSRAQHRTRVPDDHVPFQLTCVCSVAYRRTWTALALLICIFCWLAAPVRLGQALFPAPFLSPYWVSSVVRLCGGCFALLERCMVLGTVLYDDGCLVVSVHSATRKTQTSFVSSPRAPLFGRAARPRR